MTCTAFYFQQQQQRPRQLPHHNRHKWRARTAHSVKKKRTFILVLSGKERWNETEKNIGRVAEQTTEQAQHTTRKKKQQHTRNRIRQTTPSQLSVVQRHERLGSDLKLTPLSSTATLLFASVSQAETTRPPQEHHRQGVGNQPDEPKHKQTRRTNERGKRASHGRAASELCERASA